MFLHLSVILFTGVCIPACTGTDTPQVDISQHALGQTTPQANTPLGQTHIPQADTTTPGQTHPREMATAADGMHPTGMHSYSKVFLLRFHLCYNYGTVHKLLNLYLNLYYCALILHTTFRIKHTFAFMTLY